MATLQTCMGGGRGDTENLICPGIQTLTLSNPQIEKITPKHSNIFDLSSTSMEFLHSSSIYTVQLGGFNFVHHKAFSHIQILVNLTQGN